MTILSIFAVPMPSWLLKSPTLGQRESNACGDAKVAAERQWASLKQKKESLDNQTEATRLASWSVTSVLLKKQLQEQKQVLLRNRN